MSDPGRRGHHNTLSPFPSPFRSPFHSPLRCSPFKNLGHAAGHCALDLDCDDDDMNLGCFILMFDLILKQVTIFPNPQPSFFLNNWCFHRWNFETCTWCTTFSLHFVPDGAPGRRRDAGFRQRTRKGYRGHYQQCFPGSMGGLTHMPEGWEGAGVQPVSVKHSVLPVGMWTSGEADPPGGDTPGGESRSAVVTLIRY